MAESKEHNHEHKHEHKAHHEHKEHPEHKKPMFHKLRHDVREYYRKEYKKLMILPVLMLLIAIGVIIFTYATTGDYLYKSVSLKGGLIISISTDKVVDLNAIQKDMSSIFPGKDITIRTSTVSGKMTGYAIEADITDTEQVNSFLSSLEQEFGIKKENFTIEEIGSSLGASFFKETTMLLLLSFLFMAIVVFLFFRNPIISGAVILSAVSDIIITIAVLDIMKFKIGTAGIAALLMLISYSVDTDVLLSTRVLRRKNQTIFEAVLSSVNTGLTMLLATLAAVTIGLLFAQAPVLKEIMLIVFIGLVIDVFNTYIQNVGIIRWYLKDDHK
jgi:preprotein translocase subunit SecF